MWLIVGEIIKFLGHDDMLPFLDNGLAVDCYSGILSNYIEMNLGGINALPSDIIAYGDMNRPEHLLVQEGKACNFANPLVDANAELGYNIPVLVAPRFG